MIAEDEGANCVRNILKLHQTRGTAVFLGEQLDRKGFLDPLLLHKGDQLVFRNVRWSVEEVEDLGRPLDPVLASHSGVHEPVVFALGEVLERWAVVREVVRLSNLTQESLL